MSDIIFVNGESKCGCKMEFSDGRGEYSNVHEITLCKLHRENITPNTLAEELEKYTDWLWLHHNLLQDADNNKVALDKYLSKCSL